MKISVVINTYNASGVIRPTLESVGDFDEVVVCDMESTDDTVAIAHEYGCRVVTFEKKNYNICEPARDFAIHSAQNEWVLVVDADEVVTPELRQYLYSFTDEPTADALLISRKNFFMGQFAKQSYPDYQLRFFRHNLTYWPPVIHSRPEVKGTIGRVPQEREELALVHIPETMSQRINKLNTYSCNEVERRKGKKVSGFALLMSPLFRFLKFYLLKGGIGAGKVGFILACNEAIYKYLVLAKLYEHNTKEKQSNK